MSNELSLFFYLLIYGLSAVLFSIGLRKNKHIFKYMGLMIPIILSGFRYGVGTDYFNYINIFNGNITKSLEDFTENNGIFELGYFITEKISYYISGDVRLVFLITSFLTIVFFYLGLKKYKLKYPGLVFFLYLLTIFPMTMNAVRQGVAMSIMFYAITFILEKNITKYIVLTILAGLFHISALLLIPFYFIGRLFDVRKENNHLEFFLTKSKYFIRICVILIISIYILTNVFTLVLSIPGFDKYDIYQNLDEEGANYIFYVKITAIAITIIFSKYVLFNINYRQNAFLFAGAVLEALILTLGFISPFIKREALYFSPFLIMILPNFIDIIGKDIKHRLSIYTLIALYGISFFTISYYVLDQADIIPYNSSIRSHINE